MSTNHRRTHAVAPEPLQQSSFLLPEPTASADSFQAMLSHCVHASRDQEVPAESNGTEVRVETRRWQEVGADLLARAWAFLQTRYKTSTTKRLRVAETISLGEKRFVAIVTVEGREFLIGGGVSGMSLLAQLGSGPGATSDFAQKFGDGGGVR